MSQITDELTEAITKFVEAKEPITVLNRGNVEDIVAPGYEQFSSNHQMEVIKVIRRIYRHHAGREAPKSGEEWMALVKEEMLIEFREVFTKAIAHGILIGQEHIRPVKNLKHLGGYEKLFESKAYLKEVDLYQMSISADDDLRIFIDQKMADTMEMMYEGSGYSESNEENNPDLVPKIWDLWFLSGNSFGVALYRAAYDVGKTWKERDVLSGIMSATEEKDLG